MRKHVHIRGRRLPIERKKLGRGDLGRAYKGTSHRGNPERRRIEDPGR